MQVTEVRLRLAEGQGKLKATASVVFNEEFVVHDIRVIEGHRGLFVAMPSRKGADGAFRDTCHPLTPQLRTHIQDAVLAQYGKAGGGPGR